MRSVEFIFMCASGFVLVAFVGAAILFSTAEPEMPKKPFYATAEAVIECAVRARVGTSVFSRVRVDGPVAIGDALTCNEVGHCVVGGVK